jgi:hypothetical protein
MWSDKDWRLQRIARIFVRQTPNRGQDIASSGQYANESCAMPRRPLAMRSMITASRAALGALARRVPQTRRGMSRRGMSRRPGA